SFHLHKFRREAGLRSTRSAAAPRARCALGRQTRHARYARGAFGRQTRYARVLVIHLFDMRAMRHMRIGSAAHVHSVYLSVGVALAAAGDVDETSLEAEPSGDDAHDVPRVFDEMDGLK